MAPPVFSVGRDGTAVINHPLAGGRLDLRIITGFKASPSLAALSSTSLKGNTRSRHVPKGWTGEFDVDRADATVDNFCTALEEAYFNNIPFVYGTVTVFINEPDGSTSAFMFQEASLWVTDTGDFRADQIVKQKIGFEAPRRRRV